MSAQVFISPDGTSAPTPYAINVTDPGRSLRDILEAAQRLTGAAFPDLGQVTVNDEAPADFDKIIVNGDHVKVAIQVATQEVIEVPGAQEIKEENKKKEEETESTESGATGVTGAAGAPAQPKPEIKVDLSNLVSNFEDNLKHAACLMNDIEQLDKIQKEAKDLLAKSSKALAAIKEHTSTFLTVLNAGKDATKEEEARINT